ncbi:MAG: hypothetical protein HY342_07815 [Candidatus Lambdaproteobacteria bacterium]|nr:hypothetical protein [Candidatus Lambdaproteobacteria bacterium]
MLMSVLVALMVAVVSVPTLPAQQAARPPIKELMGENLALMQNILVGLMTSTYEQIPKSAEVMKTHAEDIQKNRPPEITGQVNIDRFNAYAFTLKNSTEHLLLVTQELIKHDKSPESPGMMNIDYLRVVVAGHYSNMVTTCVNCHNQFRRKPVSMMGAGPGGMMKSKK